MDQEGFFSRTMPCGYNPSDTLLSKVGLHCYNTHKGTNLQFNIVKKDNAVSSVNYYITLEAIDLVNNNSLLTLQACVWFAATKNKESLRLISTTCRIEAHVPGTGKEDLRWNPHAVDDFCKGNMPNWLDVDAVTGGDKLQFYEVKETDLQDNQWLYLFAEVALFSEWGFDLRAYLPFEIKKVVVQTREDIASNMKLKASNAIFYINFKACGGPQCRGIVRKTSDGRQGQMCLGS